MSRSSLAVSLIAGALLLGSFVPLGLGAAPPGIPGLDKTTVIVMFHPGQVPADLAGFAADHRAVLQETWAELGGAVLRVGSDAAGEALLATLLALPRVAAAELDHAWQLHAVPNDPRWSSQWGPKTVKLPETWSWFQNEGLPIWGSHAARVAVLDTGADLDHEDLAANICAERNFLGAGPAEDDNGHGSHTAGIVAGHVNNGKGIAGAGNSCLFIGKVCNSEGSCSISVIGSAVNWALNPDGDPGTDDKVHILSMSFGGAIGSSTLATAMSTAYANNVLLVASAGNDNCGPVGYPAAYAQVIAVAALEVPPVIGAVTNLVNGQTEIRAVYSNCGTQVELAAPGSSILSSVLDNGYDSYSGTSMAAPMVAGIAALVKLANPALTNEQLRCVLDMTAHDYGVLKRDVEFGHGKVRADLAVAAAEDGADCVNYEFGIGIGGQNLVVAQTPPL